MQPLLVLLGLLLASPNGFASPAATARIPAAALTPAAATLAKLTIPKPNPALASDFVREKVNSSGEFLDLGICQAWNPEFVGNGMRCCALMYRHHRERQCDKHRNRRSYCAEMTEDQQEYIEAVHEGKVPDVLKFLAAQVQHRPAQSFCTVNNGFLIRGRAIVPTPENLIRLSQPQRCTNFGTEPLAAMLEWLGRRVKSTYFADYPGIHLLIGDASAPRGGCLASLGGLRGHMSHSSGRDVDIGFLTPLRGRASPPHFHRHFLPKPNWWFLKQVFHNPYACIKFIFLDRHDIARLARVAWRDPDWKRFHRYILNIPGHNNHFHVRIGYGPGPAGCGEF